MGGFKTSQECENEEGGEGREREREREREEVVVGRRGEGGERLMKDKEGGGGRARNLLKGSEGESCLHTRGKTEREGEGGRGGEKRGIYSPVQCSVKEILKRIFPSGSSLYCERERGRERVCVCVCVCVIGR